MNVEQQLTKPSATSMHKISYMDVVGQSLDTTQLLTRHTCDIAWDIAEAVAWPPLEVADACAEAVALAPAEGGEPGGGEATHGVFGGGASGGGEGDATHGVLGGGASGGADGEATQGVSGDWVATQGVSGGGGEAGLESGGAGLL